MHADEDALRYSEELKGEGNDHFRARRWEEALTAYRTALGRLPKRPSIPKTKHNRDLDEDIASASASTPQRLENTEEEEEEEEEEEQADEQAPPTNPQVVKARAVLSANIGACYVKLNEHKEAVKACSEALLDDPDYIKALQRRATSNEHLNTWSSLTSAQEDYTTLLRIIPASSTEAKETQKALRLLKPRVEEAQKKESSEAIDKLKGIGNSILGNFGLSTDNFQFVPNGQGGYSMNFTR